LIPGRRRALLALMALLAMAAPPRLAAQSVTVRTASDALHIRVAGLRFIHGPVLDRLKDGRSVQLEFELAVVERPDGPVVASARHVFNVSFDLWEERFAVSRIGTPPRSVSHLTAQDAEAWCLDNVTLPVATMGRFGRDVPFWVHVAYQVLERETADPNESTFTLRTLIDVLSRRAEGAGRGQSVAGGPFRLPK
jgi:hypothetical protein